MGLSSGVGAGGSFDDHCKLLNQIHSRQLAFSVCQRMVGSGYGFDSNVQNWFDQVLTHWCSGDTQIGTVIRKFMGG